MKNKKLQLITVLLFTIAILFLIIGLILIGFSNFHDYFNGKLKYGNGFKEIKHYGLSYFLSYFASDIYPKYSENYYNIIKLQIGIIFCIILIPFLIWMIIIIITFDFIFNSKVKIKNNNFWDAIQNCEIINNYYVH